MDRGSYEKLSIRESAASLKKYGSTSRHVTRNENFVKHYVSNSDTLQGIALKYNVTIEQIRRANKLWASDSLFLREFLLIPSNEGSHSNEHSTPVVSPTSNSAVSPGTASSSRQASVIYDEDNIDEFLNKIDAAIATTKEDVRKTTRNSEFASTLDVNIERRKPVISRMKQIVNNNSPGGDVYQNQIPQQPPPHTVVVQQGNKVRTSIQHHELQQDELFQL